VETTGEQKLFQAVLNQAVHDYLKPTKVGGAGSISLIKGEAERFLCSDVGGWASSREAICDAAGVEPEYLKKKLREL